MLSVIAILHSVVCCQPILCSTSRPCTVVWWQILTLWIFVYKYIINIPGVTLIPFCLIREMLKGQISFENIVPGPAKVPPIKMSSVFGPRGKQSAICNKILQNLWFFGPRNRMEIWIKKSWQVCELLTSKISFRSATSEMFSSEMFHRCYTFFWCGPKGGKATRWGCPFDFGCCRRRDELRK